MSRLGGNGLRRRGLGIVVGALALLALPSAASAASVSFDGATIQYAAAPGETNQLAIAASGTDIVLLGSRRRDAGRRRRGGRVFGLRLGGHVPADELRRHSRHARRRRRHRQLLRQPGADHGDHDRCRRRRRHGPGLQRRRHPARRLRGRLHRRQPGQRHGVRRHRHGHLPMGPRGRLGHPRGAGGPRHVALQRLQHQREDRALRQRSAPAPDPRRRGDRHGHQRRRGGRRIGHSAAPTRPPSTTSPAPTSPASPTTSRRPTPRPTNSSSTARPWPTTSASRRSPAAPG